MTRLFCDCEWADNLGSELVSLALVSEDGRHRFYSEVSPLPKDPTDFVRHVVYPLLEHGYHARQQVDLTRDLRAFLTRIPDPYVLYDYAVDGALFRYALGGFELPDAALTHLLPVPPVVTTLIVESDAVRRQIDRYFVERPEKANRKHHALIDAEALRWAFCRILEDTSVTNSNKPMRDAKALAARVPIRGDGAYVLERDIPDADREAFWAFTRWQSVFTVEGGTAIPFSAWQEYLIWLSEDPDADPCNITDDTKYEWRHRTGRWI